MDIVTLAAARKSGGSGGDVTKQYVDDHLALKADKSETSEYPIASTTTGINPSITNSADGLIQDVKVYGRSDMSKNLFNQGAEHTAGVTLSIANGEPVPNVYFTTYTDYVPCTGNTSYVMWAGENSNTICAYRQDKTYISGISNYTEGTTTPLVFTTPAEAAYLRVSLLADQVSNAQLELGSTPTPYEPYFSGIRGIGEDGELEITTANSDNTASTTATVTTGIPLYAVGDVKDELDEKRGVIIKRCKKVVLDGSETWFVNTSSAGTESKQMITTTGWERSPKIPETNQQLPSLISTIGVESEYDLFYKAGSTGMGVQGGNGYFQCRIPGIATLESIQTYLASNPVTVVYELAEPYEIPLASAELSALRGLRTYASTTNVTITDNPTVDVGYLLDTDNGQAVADVQTDLQEQISNIPAWITDIPENHKNIYRGKYLGTSVSAAQLAAIADGSFDDLYVGDYWEIPVTIDGTTVSNKWRIADFDYFFHNGTDKHHAVIVPDNTLYTAQMGGTVSNGYYQSAMFTTNLNKGRTAIANAFPDMVISYEYYDVIGQTSTKYDCTAELMTLSSLTGVYSDYIHTNNLPVLPQMSLFRIMPDFIGANPNGSGHDAGFLTQTVKTNSFYWAINTTVTMIEMRTSDSYGVRPFFLLGDAGT